MLAASFSRLLTFMLTAPSARLVAGSLTSSSHLQINTPSLKLTFLAALNVAAIPDGQLPFKSFDPDVPEEDDAKGCEEEGECD